MGEWLSARVVERSETKNVQGSLLTSEGASISRNGKHNVVRVLGIDFDNFLKTTLGESTKSMDCFVLDVDSLALKYKI